MKQFFVKALSNSALCSPTPLQLFIRRLFQPEKHMATLVIKRDVFPSHLVCIFDFAGPFLPSALDPFIQTTLVTNMDHHRSYVVEIPQRPFAPFNAGLPSNAYAAYRPQCVFAIQNFGETAYLLSVPLYDGESNGQVFARAREQLSKVLRQKYYKRCISMLLTKTVVGTANIKRVRAEYSCQLSLLITC